MLARTEAILREQAAALTAKLDAEARRKGIAGYQETQSQLEKVSVAKGAIDEQKGAALEDISSMARRPRRLPHFLLLPSRRSPPA